jgi:ribosomal protein L37AE/L43A
MIRCEKCGHRNVDNADRLKQRRHDEHQCVECAAPLTEKEITAGNWRCFRCRQRGTVLRRRREKRAA